MPWTSSPSPVDVTAIEALSLAARSDKYHVKAIKPLPRRKLYEKVPLLDCFTAPCKGSCPIGQDIPGLSTVQQGRVRRRSGPDRAEEPPALHHRHHLRPQLHEQVHPPYDQPVNIRATKLVAAEKGYEAILSAALPLPVGDQQKVAVIGGGPSGMAAAFFCGRAGIPVTLFERTGALGGIVRQVIPAWRISDEAIDKDVSLMEKMGVEVKLNTQAPSVTELKAAGYTHIYFPWAKSRPASWTSPATWCPSSAGSRI